MWCALAGLLLLLQSGSSPAEMAKRLEEVVRTSPGDARAWILLAQTRAAQGDNEGALKAAEKASENAGKDSSVLFNLAVLYFRMERLDQAIDAGLRAKPFDRTAETVLLLAEAYDRKGDWEKAKVCYAEARKLDPYGEAPIFRMAQAYLRRMDFAAAAKVLEEGRATYDKSPQLELTLGVAYYGQRRFGDALDRFLRVMDLNPRIEQAYTFSGRLLEHAGERLPELQERYAAYAKLNPAEPAGFVLQAKALLEEDERTNAAKAESLLRKGLELNASDSEGHYLLGRVLEAKSDLAGAVKEYERSVELNAQEPGPHFRLARIYDRLGRREDAEKQRRLHEELSEEAGKKVALPGIQPD